MFPGNGEMVQGKSNVSQDVVEQQHKRQVEWAVPDFVGKFHLNRMTTSVPIPGTAIRVEQERNDLIHKRNSSLEHTLGEIEKRRRFRVTSRTRKAAITARVQVQATVGHRMDAVQRMYRKADGKKKRRLCTYRYAPDEQFRDFLEHVETNNIYQVKSRLLLKDQAARLVATAEEKHGHTALHRAVSLGFVEMTRMLLEAGAGADAVNAMGDSPIHCCWRFWPSDTSKYFSWKKNPYLMTTKQQQADLQRMGRDVKATVQLLRLLTRGGADVDLQRNNGEVALHIAARRGPLQALWVLLLSKACHDIVDHRTLTPEHAAARSRNDDYVAILASWPTARLQYLDSEFVQEWMKFLCDSEANLDTDLTAREILAFVRIEEHEENTSVRARGGHLLIDEVITGPVLSEEERARARMLAFSTDTVSITSTQEDSSAKNQSTGSSLAEDQRNGKGWKRESPGTGIGRDSNDFAIADGPKKKTRTKLGKEIDVFLALARDENASAPAGVMTVGGSTAYARLLAKTQLETRKNRWPGRRDNAAGSKGETPADPFGRSMTTSERRRIAALEIAEDGGVEGPHLRPATSSVLLTTRSRSSKKGSTPHPYYGRRLLTQRMLCQREREASIKPTATIGTSKHAGGEGKTCGDDGGKTGVLYLNDTRTAFNDPHLLPGPKDASLCVDGPERLHALHPIMVRCKLHERPFCELQGSRKHNENVYCSILEDYSPKAWNRAVSAEPLIPVRKQCGL